MKWVADQLAAPIEPAAEPLGLHSCRDQGLFVMFMLGHLNCIRIIVDLRKRARDVTMTLPSTPKRDLPRAAFLTR
jgi:hypothetical protein